MRGRLGWESVVDRIRALDPDIVILSEVPGTRNADELGTAFGPDFRAVKMSSVKVAARGKVALGKDKMRGPGKSYLVHVQLRQGALSILVVDLPSDPLRPRAPGLRTVVEEMEQYDPDLVVGDFNAPRDSNRLSNLPAGFRHAYWEIGSGWSYTWPVPLPLWALDQCIVGRRVRPLHYELDATLLSDHRMQILDFRFGDDRAIAPAGHDNTHRRESNGE
jgi:vancomycin resistance protein VanJ